MQPWTRTSPVLSHGARSSSLPQPCAHLPVLDLPLLLPAMVALSACSASSSMAELPSSCTSSFPSQLVKADLSSAPIAVELPSVLPMAAMPYFLLPDIPAPSHLLSIFPAMVDVGPYPSSSCVSVVLWSPISLLADAGSHPRHRSRLATTAVSLTRALCLTLTSAPASLLPVAINPRRSPSLRADALASTSTSFSIAATTPSSASCSPNWASRRRSAQLLFGYRFRQRRPLPRLVGCRTCASLAPALASPCCH